MLLPTSRLEFVTENFEDLFASLRKCLALQSKARFPLGEFVRATRAKTRIRQRDWLKLASEKICRKQVGSVPTFLSVRANKFAKWKTGLRQVVLKL